MQPSGIPPPPFETSNSEAFSVFVGDLAPEVTDFILQETFRQFYPSVSSAKVITDPAAGRSKGYGFVRFASEDERDRALELQGYVLGGRPIRVSLATARRPGGGGGGGVAAPADAAPHPADLDPANTTLFVGGLSPGVSEDQLRGIFGQCGEIVYVKIPAGKGCGFVQFVARPSAEMAMASLNGMVIGASAIRISWGRSTGRSGAARGGGGPAGAAFAYAGPQHGAAAAAGAGGYLPVAGGGFVAVPAAYGGYNGAQTMGGAFAPVGAYGVGMMPAGDQQQSGAVVGVAPMQAAYFNGYPVGHAPGGGAAAPAPFDPSALASVDSLNAAFAARHQEMLGGGMFLLRRH